ncbi:hypothetical protein ACQKND_16165 [Viridibacillus arvi]|uniref:hypothetical protein n=1 Tax=Viridibacillus arvi TaxID=263475 RepID=UPI003D004019
MSLLKKREVNTEEVLEVEMNKPKKKQEKKKKIDLKARWAEMRVFFPAIQIIIASLIIGGFIGWYMFMLTRSVALSVIIGVISGLVGFYVIVYIPKEIAHKQHILKELQRYTTNMTFYLQAGYNIMDALKEVKKQADKEIAEDIELTLVGLERKAILYTDHFKKYRFDALDIYHDVLNVMYQNGGNPKELFHKPNKAINFELVSSDKLYRRKKALRQKIYVMMGTSALMPFMISFQTADLYDVFLSTGITAYTICCLYVGGFLFSLYRLQKNALDITVY